MEPLHLNVDAMNQHDRQAIEHLLGKELRNDQQLIINLVTPTSSIPANGTNTQPSAELPDWCDVYRGLSDEQIEDLDQAIKVRLDLTREKR